MTALRALSDEGLSPPEKSLNLGTAVGECLRGNHRSANDPTLAKEEHD
jgi:hypothetical protein